MLEKSDLTWSGGIIGYFDGDLSFYRVMGSFP